MFFKYYATGKTAVIGYNEFKQSFPICYRQPMKCIEI